MPSAENRIASNTQRARNERRASHVPPPAARGRRRWPFVLLVLVVILTAVVAGGWLWFRRLLDGPVASRDFTATVVIARGAPYRTIIEQLRAAQLLPHPFVFDYLAWRRGNAGRLRPGRYTLRSSMSVRQIYERLLEGAPIRLTVPEGLTLEQVAGRLADGGLATEAGVFLEAARAPDFLDRHGIEATSCEGYVLPETYFFDPGVGGREILETMVAAFEREFHDEAATTTPQSLTWHQLVTLASMIEREARSDAEKPTIASVYYNRLRRNMKLECDATVRYALSKWPEPLTRDDLKTSSPYNTYLHKGLPPGPISTIGRRSLEAALRPARSDYLYYCLKDVRTHHFSRTFAEHQRAVKKYLRKGLTGGSPER
jgi:UPF0755 protein